MIFDCLRPALSLCALCLGLTCCSKLKVEPPLGFVIAKLGHTLQMRIPSPLSRKKFYTMEFLSFVLSLGTSPAAVAVSSDIGAIVSAQLTIPPHLWWTTVHHIWFCKKLDIRRSPRASSPSLSPSSNSISTSSTKSSSSDERTLLPV